MKMEYQELKEEVEETKAELGVKHNGKRFNTKFHNFSE